MDDSEFLRDLVHDVVQTVKARLKVDWTQPHRDAVQAEVRSSVKRVLYDGASATRIWSRCRKR